MAANKFATIFYNNRNKITLILIYAILEWTLIILLLFNSVLSYLIIKFAQYFGLSPPCFSCARMDRFRYHLCDLHSKEVSHMGFCSIHQKLAGYNDMCDDCSSSVLGFEKEPRNFVFSKVEQINVIECDGEDKVNLKCSCCSVKFEKKFVDDSSCFVIHPVSDILDDAKKGNLIDDHFEKRFLDEKIESGYVEENHEFESKKQSGEDEIDFIKDLNSFEQNLIQFDKGEDLNSHDLQFFIDYSGTQLFPFELIDSKAEENHNISEEEDHKFGDFQKAQVNLQEIDYSVHKKTEESSEFVENLIDYTGNQAFPFKLLDLETKKNQTKSEDEDHVLLDTKTQENRNNSEDEDHEFGDFQKAQVNSREIDYSIHQKTEESSNFVLKSLASHENLIDFGNEEISIEQEIRTPLINTNTKQLREIDSDIHSVQDEEEEVVSIGTEIPVLDPVDEIKHEEPSTDFEGENVDEIDEEKAPETPGSIHSYNPLHKKWLMHEMKELGVEESFDGSVISEPDGDDPMNTAEKLKLALKAERKALRDLYLELEEERNASMVAANETMFMINRLQEEKSAMQMEALQYQRMMEEQSEYDQEALQLLNELMMKKEKELELCRKKVSDYEAKEKIRVLQRGMRVGTSSVSWSHSEDDEGLSDLYQVPKDENALVGNGEVESQHTPVDHVLDLESSLADFDDERMSILEQLKVLEEKLFALSDEEDRHFANLRVIDDHYEETNNYGFGKNGKQPMGKRLLPLFDAISNGNEDGVTVRNGYENGFHSTKFDDSAITRFELEKKRIDMEEEVDQLYGRLQSLEADREFLKHCIVSISKGDKGIELLQEILYHLRDLRNVNIRAKNYTENALL